MEKIALILIGLLTASCATPPRESFLFTNDTGWMHWLDDEVEYFPAGQATPECRFKYFREKDMTVGAFVGEACDPDRPGSIVMFQGVSEMTFSLPFTHLSRRDALYLMSKQCNVSMTWGSHDNGPPLGVDTNCLLIRKK